MVSTARGQYLASLEYVNPSHVSKFSFLIALIHVDLTVNTAADVSICPFAVPSLIVISLVSGGPRGAVGVM